MKLLANENFPIKSVLYLRSRGIDIRSIGTDHPGVTDQVVMDIAIEEDRTILTFDRDYGELIFKHNYRPPKGVIYFRLDTYEADEPGRLIDGILNTKTFDFSNALTVIDSIGIRQRKY